MIFSSSHSKPVKRGIVSFCFTNAVRKSCGHVAETSLSERVASISSAGCPTDVLASVAGTVLKIPCQSPDNTGESVTSRNKNLAVIPYIDKISRGQKKVAGQVGVEVIFAHQKSYKNCASSQNCQE